MKILLILSICLFSVVPVSLATLSLPALSASRMGRRGTGVRKKLSQTADSAALASPGQVALDRFKNLK